MGPEVEQDPRVILWRQVAQNLSELARGEFARSTSATDHFGQSALRGKQRHGGIVVANGGRKIPGFRLSVPGFPVSGFRFSVSGNEERRTKNLNKEPGTENRRPATGNGQPAAGNRNDSPLNAAR
jgi:hypothetical protein